MAHKDDQTVIATTHNTARYFTEKRQVAWVALVGTIIWGVIGFFAMPQRKDPDIPALSSLVITPWPGMDAERVEERVTRRIEEVVAENDHVDVVRSTTRTGVSYVFIDLKEGTKGTGEIFDDIGLKLSQTDLANMLGVTREAVNKQLGAWAQRGLIQHTRGTVIICDPQGLKQEASPEGA